MPFLTSSDLENMSLEELKKELLNKKELYTNCRE